MDRVFADLTPPAPWLSDLDDTLHCVQVRQETHDVKTFVLATGRASSYRYLPGQFITLELQIDGQPINRCYTLSSTPTRPDRISITVKRMPGGLVSNWLHDNLRPGSTLGARGPGGSFSCFVEPAQRYLFLSGGSGITPLMSMTRALHDLASDTDVVFVHCARTPADILFAEELTLLARNMPHFRVAVICEWQPPGSPYAGHLGRIDGARLAHIAPDYLERDVYTCGPAPFMGAVRSLLGDAGYDMARYRQESFTFETLAPASAAPEAPASVGANGGDEAAAAQEFQITLPKLGKKFPCRSDQPILQAATAAGLRLPFSCSNGICGTCKSKKISGTVEMKHAGGIRQREIDQGWVLPCCSRPLSDVTLDR
jgi:ferredoxin-NADP reductase